MRLIPNVKLPVLGKMLQVNIIQVEMTCSLISMKSHLHINMQKPAEGIGQNAISEPISYRLMMS